MSLSPIECPESNLEDLDLDSLPDGVLAELRYTTTLPAGTPASTIRALMEADASFPDGVSLDALAGTEPMDLDLLGE